MKILVNTRLLRKSRTDGIYRYAYEILSRLVFLRPQDQFIFLFDRPFDSSFIFAPNVKGVFFPFPTISAFSIRRWFDIIMPAFVRFFKPDVIFSPDGFVPLIPSGIPIINTVHDLNFLHQPEWIPSGFRHFYLHTFRQYVARSNFIITVSHTSKEDIVRQLQVPAEKVAVIYNGVSPFFLTERTYSFPMNRPYFLYVGSIHQRKNILRLQEAFIHFNQKHHLRYMLILAGKNLFGSYILLKDPNIKFIENPEDSQLYALYSNALGVVNVSLFEGFGIPLIEAMAFNLPLLLSDIPVFREITRSRAIFVDPHDVMAIAQGFEQLCHLVNHPEKKHSYQDLLTLYNWDSAAQQLSELVSRWITC